MKSTSDGSRRGGTHRSANARPFKKKKNSPRGKQKPVKVLEPINIRHTMRRKFKGTIVTRPFFSNSSAFFINKYNHLAIHHPIFFLFFIFTNHSIKTAFVKEPYLFYYPSKRV